MPSEMTDPLDTGQRQNATPVCAGNTVQRVNSRLCRMYVTSC